MFSCYMQIYRCRSTNYLAVFHCKKFLQHVCHELICVQHWLFCLMPRRKKQKKRKRRRQRLLRKKRKVAKQMKLMCSTGRECLVLRITITLFRHWKSKRKLQRRLVKENAFVSRSTMLNKKWWQLQPTVQRYGSNSWYNCVFSLLFIIKICCLFLLCFKGIQ